MEGAQAIATQNGWPWYMETWTKICPWWLKFDPPTCARSICQPSVYKPLAPCTPLAPGAVPGAPARSAPREEQVRRLDLFFFFNVLCFFLYLYIYIWFCLLFCLLRVAQLGVFSVCSPSWAKGIASCHVVPTGLLCDSVKPKMNHV